MDPLSWRDGALTLENLPLEQLAERHGTPLFVYSHAALVGNLRELTGAFGSPPPLVCYSVKANPSLAVIRTLAREGAGADVVSLGELQRALRAGVPPERIVFSGVGKRPDELAAAADAGIRAVNVEVADELPLLDRIGRELGSPVPVSFRVNPDVDARTHEYITVGRKVNKFGIPLADVPALYRQAAELPGLRPRGVDCHIGSQLTDVEPFAQALARIADLVRDLRRDGLTVEEVDVGGGLGVRYTDESPPALADYARTIRSALDPLGVEVVLEPGRVIAALAGVFLTRVLYRKQTAGKLFLIVDGAMNDLPRPSLYGARHAVWPVRQGRGTVQADVVGPVCETGDFLAREREVPDAQPGDLLAILGAGAYCRSMASNYNSRPRAAEVLVRGGEAHLIQERERLEDLWARERIPGFLS